jgi:SulP family sulfate permease
MKVFEELKGRTTQELLSGVLVSVIALPLALAFGSAAYGPLGAGYGALGAIAGLIGAGITGLLASLFGGTPTQVTGPTGPMSVVAKSTIVALLGSSVIEALPEDQRALGVIWLFGVSVVLGGLLQWILIKTKLGNLVKDLPYPVVAGFMNGVSLLIILGNVRPFLGWADDAPWEDLFPFLDFDHPSYWENILNFQWPAEVLAALAASLITAAVIFLLPKLTKKIPATFAALILGSLTYYALGWGLNLGFTDWANNPQIIGEIQSSIPRPELLLNLGANIDLLFNGEILGLLLQYAVVLGLLGTIDTLLTSVIADLKLGTRHSSSRELFGQGLGNIVSGIFGGLPGAGATVRTLSNIENGGRTRWSGAFHGLLILLGLMILGPFFMVIPKSVLGAILVVIALKMVDTWSLELSRKRSARGDSLVLWLVTGVTVFSDLIIAVTAGLILAGILFVRRQKAVGTRLKFSDGLHLRSCVQRSEAQDEVLQKYGEEIQVVQLRGNLFFGTSDDLMGMLEHRLPEGKITVLDMEQLTSLDLTGGKMLIDLLRRWVSENKTLLWGGWKEDSQTDKFLAELGIKELLGEGKIFETFDFALERAEEMILVRNEIADHALSLEELPVLLPLSTEEQSLLIQEFELKSLEDQEYLFYEGQTNTDIYFVLEGVVEVHGLEPQEEKVKRLTAYGPGQGLGVMSWLEDRPKQYTAKARGPVRLAWLPEGTLDRLTKDQPSLGAHLIKAWAQKLSRRVRRFQNTDLHLSEN